MCQVQELENKKDKGLGVEQLRKIGLVQASLINNLQLV